jgi:glycosyltransferase involved in cell wall biosynthesis
MKTPIVSVITVSKNSARFIEDNILSVKYQDYPKIEHIIVDGGSTDLTLNILRKYDKIRWISEPDKGVTDAFNKGIYMSSGDILTFLNSDDVYHSRDSVHKAVVAVAKENEAGVIFGDCSFIDANGNVIGFSNENKQQFSFFALLCSEFTIPLASAFIKRSAVEAIEGNLDASLDFAPDWELWVRIGLKFPLIYISDILGSTRKYEGAIQNTLRCATENPAKRRLVLDSVFSRRELSPKTQALQKRAYAGTYITEALMLLRIGYRKMARECIWMSFKLYPRYVLNLLVISYIVRSLGWGALVDKASLIRRKILKREACLEENTTVKWWLQ